MSIGPASNHSGYAYVEVLIAAVVLSLGLVPAINALRETVTHSATTRELLTLHFEATARMETVLALPFSELEAEAASTGGVITASYSDTPGTANRILVWLSPYDLDNADGDNNTLTGTEVGVVLVKVEMPSSGIDYQTLAGEA